MIHTQEAHPRGARAAVVVMMVTFVLGLSAERANAGSVDCGLGRDLVARVTVIDATAEITGSGGKLVVNGQNCGNLTIVSKIIVTGSEQREIVKLPAALGPGYGGEPSIAEIEVEISLGEQSFGQGDSLTIIGGSGPDHVTVGTAGINPNSDSDVDITLSGVEGILIDGLGSVDTLSGAGGGETGAPTTIPLTLYGRDGNDVLTGGAASDMIRPSTGEDDVFGGISGNDFVSYLDYTSGVVVDLGSGKATGPDDIDAATVESAEGSHHDDVLLGSNVANHLRGLKGIDTLVGLLGADELSPGPDNDVIVDGGPDFDKVWYKDAEGPVQVDLMLQLGTGANGTDPLTGIEGAVGSDYDDTLTGTSGVNHLHGEGGTDALLGLDGDDLIYNGEGKDAVSGGAGNDTLVGDPGEDILSGGSGVDLLTYWSSASWVAIDLTAKIATSANDVVDTLAGIENADGSPFFDILVGSSEDNVLKGLGGDDWLFGLAGNDALDGGQGLDLCDQGSGSGSKTNCEY